MLRLDQVQVTVRQITILRGVSLEVRPGTVAGLVGRNGAGKTTTLRTVMGLMPLTGGRIWYQGTELSSVPAHRRAALGIGYMPEDRRLIPSLTVQENLLLPAWANGFPDAEGRLETVYGWMPGLRAMAGRAAGQLSGGQQKLVALGRALVVGTRLLLLDEPFEGLAPALADQLEDALREAVRQGRSVLLAESEHHRVETLADRVYVIERGEVFYAGRAE
ncbi:MAG: ATP-binding cassette domain-containing protein [Armatimonadota bacterium]|nr:ATP-binding cassette domain-containing protein [Armatimonadota bacterium]MDW8156324.1 ATP-binding cassette domain-containing protein [Armatimonadota bacterium]